MEQRSQFKYFGRYSRFLLFRKLHIVPFVSNKHCLLYAFHGGLTLQIQLLNNYEADVHNWVHWLDLGKMGWWGALGHGGIIHWRAHQPAALLLNPGFSGFTLLVEQMENAAIKLVSAYLIYWPALFTVCSTTDLTSPLVRDFVTFCFVCNWEKMFRIVKIRGTLPRLLFENENNQGMVEWKLDIYHLKFFLSKKVGEQ